MTATSVLSPTRHPTGYRHEALFWDGTEEFLAGTVPFVSAGLAAGMPVLVAVHDERWQGLRSALGAGAERPALAALLLRHGVAGRGGARRGTAQPPRRHLTLRGRPGPLRGSHPHRGAS